MAILTVDLFNQYSDNYFLSNNAPNNILNGSVRKTLPQTIINTETSLNAMLNGRLYQKYSPSGNIQFKDTTEKNTLYSALTECVLYRIQTGEYINLHNTYSGNVNGTNNFSSGNSNVIGLRNDIRDKLVFLGLYQSGSFTNATLPSTQTTINSNLITADQWSLILSNLASAKTLTFNGTVNLNGTVSMLPSQVQLGHYGTMNEIYESLEELGQILTNYKSASGSTTSIPFLGNLMTTEYYPLNIGITFTNSNVGEITCNINQVTVTGNIITNSNSLTLTLTFTSFFNINGLHLEASFTGSGWLENASSCIINPYGYNTTNWNVSTSYPSWQYTFAMTQSNPTISFTINKSPSPITYSLNIHGYVILVENLLD